MNRSWQSLRQKIDKMISKVLRHERVSTYNKLLLHGLIWTHFKNGRYKPLQEQYEKLLTFYVSDLMTLRTKKIRSFKKVNRLLTSLFHSPRLERAGFRILQQRLRLLRSIERERNEEMERNYLLYDKHRGFCNDDFFKKLYRIPPELFKTIFDYL